MKIKFFAGIFFLLIGIQISYAQMRRSPVLSATSKSGEKGFIIGLAGDTVYGFFDEKIRRFEYDHQYIDMSPPPLFHKEVWFTTYSTAPFRKYTPRDIQGFQLPGSQIFYQVVVPLQKPSKAFFARNLIQGPVSFFARRMPTDLIPQEFYLLGRDRFTTFTLADAAEKLTVFFSDDAELAASIQQGEFLESPEGITILVRKYNERHGGK
jgi:hypothetical protein